MTVEVTPVTGALGARVANIDLSNLNDDDGRILQAALDKYLVVQVSGQSLDRFQLSSLGKRFGQPFIHPIVSNGFEDCPDVLELVREPQDKLMFGGESWHADVTWMQPSGYVSILHAKEIPAVGGDTAFVSTIEAFRTLSAGLQQMLRGLKTIHSYHWYEGLEKQPWCVEQPVVRQHPVNFCGATCGAPDSDSGSDSDTAGVREGLYISRMFCSRFTDMTPEESAPLLEYLYRHLEKHEFSCRFHWSVGDVLLWDNRFTLHYPINDFIGVRRRMIRTTSLET